MKYFLDNLNRDITHTEIVPIITKQWEKMTGKPFAEPDRAIRTLHQKGKLIKVKKGVYRYDPMIPTNRIPTHPGVILLNEIINGKSSITPETAWLLSQAFKTTPQFWMNLQTNYDLALNRPKQIKEAITF